MLVVLTKLGNGIAQAQELPSDYEKMDASLIKWQRGMSALLKDIVDTTPAGEIADSSLEFKFDGNDRRYMRSMRLSDQFYDTHARSLSKQAS